MNKEEFAALMQACPHLLNDMTEDAVWSMQCHPVLLNDLSGGGSWVPYREWKFIGTWLTPEEFLAIRCRQEKWRTYISNRLHNLNTPGDWLKWSLSEISAHLYLALLWWRPSWKLIVHIAINRPIFSSLREARKWVLQKLRGSNA